MGIVPMLEPSPGIHRLGWVRLVPEDIFMFGNLINSQDVRSVFRLAAKSEFRRLYRMLTGGREARVREAWSHLANPESGMWEIPAVQARWRRMVTGDEQVGFYNHFFPKYTKGRYPCVLSLACGPGETEIQIAKTGSVCRIDGYDISGERIEFATARSREEGVGETAFFHVADVLKAEIRENSYDVVLAEGALHHFTPLHAVYDKIFRALKGGGYLVINDFVGPTRFQWTDRQLEAANSILRALPARYRTRRDGTPKPEIFRPSRLSMIVGDPSEAVDSSGIMSKVRERFEVVEERGYGGAILHILLAGIAHNFLGQDSQTESILQAIFSFEDALMSSGEIDSDYVFAVFRPREPQA
jgi:SAM-dependent methyltransferase